MSVNDDLYTSSSQVSSGGIFSPRKEADSQTELKDSQKDLKALLQPVEKLIDDVVERDRQEASDFGGYMAAMEGKEISNTALMDEYRGRQIFLAYLDTFKGRLLTALKEEHK